jgi:hypothetical protein
MPLRQTPETPETAANQAQDAPLLQPISPPQPGRYEDLSAQVVEATRQLNEVLAQVAQAKSDLAPEVEKFRHAPPAQYMLHQLLQSRMAQDQKFYLVRLPEDEMPSVEVFDRVEQLCERITALVGTETALFPFMGYWLQITKGEMRHLLTPFGMLPLFQLPQPDQVEVEAHGWVGRESPITTIVRPPPVDAAADEDSIELPLPVEDEDTPVMPVG